MKKQNVAYMQMIGSLQDFFVKSAEKIKDDQIILKTLGLIAALVALINKCLKIQGQDITGISKKKLESKKSLARFVFAISSIVRTFAYDNKDYPMYNMVKLSITKITRMKQAEMLVYVETVKELANANLEALRPYGLTDKMFEELEAGVKDFEYWDNRPRDARKEKATATKEMKGYIADLRDIVKGNLDNAMEKYIITDNLFYSAYEKIREIDDPITIHRSIRILTLNEETRLAEPFVAVTIVRASEKLDFTNAVRKLTTEDGRLELSGYEPGEYMARFEKGGFDTLDKKFYVNEKITTKLEVALRAKE